MPLVKFIENDDAIRRKRLSRQEAIRENTFRYVPEPGGRASNLFPTDLVPDKVAWF
jgi:hypothetical protein